jgi:hypothetical protein
MFKNQDQKNNIRFIKCLINGVSIFRKIIVNSEIK